MPQLQTARPARLEARISPDLKRRLEYAASLRGSTLTEFVVQSAQEAATRTIRENEVLVLSGVAAESSRAQPGASGSRQAIQETAG